MPRRIALALALALALIPPFAFPQSGEPFYGVVIDAPPELRDMLQEGLQLVRWQEDPQMSAELLQRLVDEAVKEAKEAVATRGYFGAKVSYEIDRGGRPWVVRLHVEPGERTRVQAVDLQFTGPAVDDPEAEQVFRKIRREWPLRKGEPFTQRDWEEAKRDAVRKLATRRYAAARVASSRAEIDPETRSASLRVQLDSGPPFRFGPVEVIGTRRYDPRVVENLSPVKPGEDYDRNALALYGRRLLETGYFASARVEMAPEVARADAAPVRAAVIEGNSQQIETGISYNTDTQLRLELRHRNADLLDSAWRMKESLRLDSKIKEARVDFDSPPDPGARWRNYFVNLRDSTIQNEENSELSFGVSFNQATAAAPTSYIISTHLEEQRIAGELADERRAVYFGVRRAYRGTDELVSPRSGYVLVLTAGGAPAGLATIPFGRATAQASLFFPVRRDADLVLRGDVGMVFAQSRKGIPSTFLFRTGGDQTVRGYAFESLGVREGDAVVGGRYQAVGSAEYIHWLGESWGLAAFVDAGNAWDSGRADPAVGIGAGPRFRTPIGPVRADIAYGERTGNWRVHFSVGFTF